MDAENKKFVKYEVGLVVSDKMNKTISVKIDYKKTDKKFGKIIAQSKKILAHDQEEKAKIGDMVRLKEVRPLSKNKRHELVEILKK